MKKIVFTSALVGLVAMHSSAADLPSKSGFLLGLDWSLGLGKGSSVATDTPIGAPNAIPVITANFDNKTLTNSAKLVLGYQQYSQKVSKLGFNIKAKVGLGFAQMGSVMTKNIDNNGTNHALSGEGVATAYIPLTLGVESNFLVDFVESGEHVFGGSVGLGYEFMYGLNVDNSFKNVTANLSPFVSVFNAGGVDYSVISPKVGLHYYYQNHQFGLDVSFDKVLQKSVVAVEKAAGNNTAAKAEQVLATDYNRFCTISLNYAYRF